MSADTQVVFGIGRSGIRRATPVIAPIAGSVAAARMRLVPALPVAPKITTFMRRCLPGMEDPIPFSDDEPQIGIDGRRFDGFVLIPARTGRDRELPRRAVCSGQPAARGAGAAGARRRTAPNRPALSDRRWPHVHVGADETCSERDRGPGERSWDGPRVVRNTVAAGPSRPPPSESRT